MLNINEHDQEVELPISGSESKSVFKIRNLQPLQVVMVAN